MPAFEYVALKPSGRQDSGVLEGDTARQIRQILRDRGLIPVRVEPVAEQRSQGSRRPRGRSMSAADLSLFTRQLATLVRSGSPVEEALATAARQSTKGKVKSVILGVRSRLVEGYNLAQGLADFPNVFPDLYRSTVAAGEQSGHLDGVLDRLADYTEARQETRQKIQMALFYPALLILMSILVLGGLLGYVVPQVVQVFENIGQDLPTLTVTLIAISEFVQAYGLILLVAGGGSAIVLQRLLRLPGYRRGYHRLLLRLPLIGPLVNGINTARFARTLSILAASGVPILEALRISAEVVANIPMREAIESAAERVREGSAIHKALERSNLFPPMTVYLIASGETSGNLEEMLERAAIQQERETNATIQTTLALFEPLLILLMGGIVLIIVLAILLPIFELNQLVQ